MSDSKIISSSEMMMDYATVNFSSENDVCTVWKKVVSKIHSNKYESEDSERRMPIGERLSKNTRVVDVKNGVLLVESDHSGWIQYLRFYQSYILKGLKMSLPELKIHSLAYRVSGSSAGLSVSYEERLSQEQQKMTTRMDKTEKELEQKFGSESKPEGNLPPEILEKFERLKQSMLTNDEK